MGQVSGLKISQVRRLKDLEKENQRLRKAVSDLTLDALILREVVERESQDGQRPMYLAFHGVGWPSIMCRRR